MLPDDAQSIAYFKQLDLTLAPFTVRRRGREVTRWRLHAGRRVFRVDGHESFASTAVLWKE